MDVGRHTLIFSEVTKAMNRDWHSGHFACFKCDTDLIGNRYVIQDSRPYCTGCYESLFGSTCAECKEIIGIGAKDLTYKELHWHEKCFFCCDCKKSLVGESFGTHEDKLYCSECHDNNFAPRCDFCKEVFRSGVKKFEWSGKKWHEQCFHCDECKEVIADHSFVPHEEKAVCVPCFERLYAPKCTKCEGVISKSGITYKSSPWHRECFTCTHCTITLAGETFTSQDDKPYCAPCFGELFAKKCRHCKRPLTAANRCGDDQHRSTCCEPCYGQLFAKKCNQCLKPITGPGTTKFVTFEDRHWHSDCFICHKCNTSLTGQGFILDDTNNVLCARCAPL